MVQGQCYGTVNKLNSLMKTTADEAGFDEKRRLTNHSARKTMVQKLNDNNIPPIHIMQLSGHRNVQSVNNYSTISNEEQKNMPLILSGNTTSTSIEKRPVSSSRSGVATECCESSFMKSSSFPAAGPFSGAVFHGGQFNITKIKHCKQVTNFHRSLNRVYTKLQTHHARLNRQTKTALRSDKLNFIGFTNFGFVSFVISLLN